MFLELEMTRKGGTEYNLKLGKTSLGLALILQ